MHLPRISKFHISPTPRLIRRHAARDVFVHLLGQEEFGLLGQFSIRPAAAKEPAPAHRSPSGVVNIMLHSAPFCVPAFCSFPRFMTTLHSKFYVRGAYSTRTSMSRMNREYFGGRIIRNSQDKTKKSRPRHERKTWLGRDFIPACYEALTCCEPAAGPSTLLRQRGAVRLRSGGASC
jgi:hypothetical protein